jgi:deoxyribodipyrimidine photo-lyase
MTDSVFIFRRDLRLVDNTGLLEASRQSGQVHVCFIWDDNIMARFTDHDFRLAFLRASLVDLAQQVSDLGGHLNILSGEPLQVLSHLLGQVKVGAVYVNRDYTPFSRRRDAALAGLCAARGVDFHVSSDALLNEPEQVYKGDGGHYAVFTPFYNRARQLFVAPPQLDLPRNLSKQVLGSAAGVRSPSAAEAMSMSAPGPTSAFTPGRRGALQVLENLAPLANYGHDRDFPALPGTSHLSAHLKFGTCSVREAWQQISEQLGAQHPMLRQLYWRDFYCHIAHHRPRVFGHAFRRLYDGIRWRTDAALLQQWAAGKTGFPIIDAGMRELVATGYMHNRVRMVVASFLVKNLHIDWRLGEAFFARYLVDYDPSVNNGSWQWAASTGADAQPYFRVFNPWRQQLRFDADGVYIKRWLPELAAWPAKAIHRLEQDSTGYLPPMVDLRSSAEEIKAQFKGLNDALG